eukprot:TRINITY_DN2508_c0_g2_i1.p1 TRINITY_DN2508_c0_g2~~TRINITY_DN2508_c0_g2_i1.p1  ORF type:complete len:355 (-),score=41.31 TRINITY_DN2508_c0_g2_i1:3034-4098(-)
MSNSSNNGIGKDVLGSNHSRYVKVKDLNQGTFGFVQLCKDKETNEKVAIKFIKRGEEYISKYVDRELQNHRLLIHPHVVQFKEAFVTDEFLGIAMEYAAGGDLFDYVVKRGGLKEDEARWFFQQLIVAIDYCHKMGIVNRDIKLENTLLDGSKKPLLKLCDFGYSKNESMDSQPKSKVGTPGYIAPEIIKNERYDGKESDIWSCGVILYIMLVGGYPFERAEDKKSSNKLHIMIQRILRADYIYPKSLHLSPECKDLIAKILVVEPRKRLTIQQVFEHPWFRINLPKGVEQMNSVLPQPPKNVQTKEQLQEVLQIARTTKEGQKNNNNPVVDDLINAELDNPEMSFEVTSKELL